MSNVCKYKSSKVYVLRYFINSNHVRLVLENEKWDTPIVIAKEQNEDNGTIKGKIMKLIPGGRVKLETFVDQMYIER